MTDRALDDLIAAAEAGEGNRNDGSLYHIFGDAWVHPWSVIDRGCLTSAVKLLHKALPGWDWTMHGNGQALLWPPGTVDEQNKGCIEVDIEDSPARALLIAILKAYRGMQG